MNEAESGRKLSGKSHLRVRLVAISISFFVGTALMLGKFYAYRLTSSSAILSDALESIINVVASGFALGSVLFALISSLRPWQS